MRRWRAARAPGSGDLELGEGGEVEQRDALAGGYVFGGNRGRPLSRFPAVAGFAGDGQRVQQAGVGVVPLRTLPARVLEEDRAEFLLARVEGGEAQVARMVHLLARVDDVVHLAVLLGGARSDVGAAVGVGMEAQDVALAQVGCRLPIRYPLRDGPAHSPGVRYPDGLGGPESADVGGLSKHGEAVVGE